MLPSIMVIIRIPASLRQYCDGLEEVRISAGSVGDAIRGLADQYPQLGHAVLAETGDVRGFVNIFVNDQDVRFLGRLEAPVAEGDVLHILPSIAGG